MGHWCVHHAHWSLGWQTPLQNTLTHPTLSGVSLTGTGGGISIRTGNLVYLAPSGVQKERIKPEHVFVLPYPQAAVPTPGSKREFLRVPTTKGLKESACTPLFWNAFRMKDAGACIHTHSQHAGEFSPTPHPPLTLPSSSSSQTYSFSCSPSSPRRSARSFP